MKASKWVLMALIVLASALALSGCMNTGNNAVEQPSASVMPSASMNPGGVANPSVPGGVTGGGPATPFNWVTNAPQVETAINQISEIVSVPRDDLKFADRISVSAPTWLAACMYWAMSARRNR